MPLLLHIVGYDQAGKCTDIVRTTAEPCRSVPYREFVRSSNGIFYGMRCGKWGIHVGHRWSGWPPSRCCWQPAIRAGPRLRRLRHNPRPAQHRQSRRPRQSRRRRRQLRCRLRPPTSPRRARVAPSPAPAPTTRAPRPTLPGRRALTRERGSGSTGRGRERVPTPPAKRCKLRRRSGLIRSRPPEASRSSTRWPWAEVRSVTG